MLTKKNQTDIQISQVLVRSNKLQFFTVWDVKKQEFKRNTEAFYRVWKEENDIPDYIHNDPGRFKITKVDLSNNIPADIVRILELGADFSDQEKENLAKTKLRQLISVFIFDNKKMGDQMKELYGGKT